MCYWQICEQRILKVDGFNYYHLQHYIAYILAPDYNFVNMNLVIFHLAGNLAFVMTVSLCKMYVTVA